MTAPMPAAGDPAPDFSAPTAAGEPVVLSDLRGSWALLYFYPKDDTPGCTRQACNLRDHFGALQDAGVVVLGVSGDDAASHERFAAKYDLPFPLLADPDRAMQEAYGVWGQKNLYGRSFTGTKRTSFLIDPDGIVRHVFERPKTAAHTEEVLAKLEGLV